MAALSRLEGGEVGKRRAKDGVLFAMKGLMEGPAYPRDLQRDFGFSRGTIRYHLNRLVSYELAKQLKDKRYAFIDYVDGQEEVIKAVGRWRRVAYRYPTVDACMHFFYEIRIEQDIHWHNTGWPSY